MKSILRKEFIYNSQIESIASQARMAINNEELASVCKKLNIADEIYLGKVDLWLAKHALSAVYRSLKLYPKLRSELFYFGTLNGFINKKGNLIDRVSNGNAILSNLMNTATANVATSCRQAFEVNGLAMAFFTGNSNSFFSGIIINGKSLNQQTVIKNLEYGELSGYSPQGCKSIKSAVDHEIGHLLDFMLGISDSSEYRKFIKEYDIDNLSKNLSKYSVLNNSMNHREIVAEAFSEYRNNLTPRMVASFIGELINRKYKERFDG